MIVKPWGSEELLEKNEKYVLKRLFMKKGEMCSLQYHNFKHETIYVVSGVLKIYIGDSGEFVIKNPNEFLAILPKIVHRMEGVEDCYYLESSTPELDDVVRIQDNYGRS